MSRCSMCGKKSGFFDPVLNSYENKLLCQACRDKLISNEKAKKQEFKQKLEEGILSVLVVTTETIPGKRITKIFNMITSEQVIGTGWLTEQLSTISDTFGTTSEAYQNKFIDVKELAYKHIRYQAYKLGANAIVATEVKYFVTGGKNMIMFAISGTPVVIED